MDCVFEKCRTLREAGQKEYSGDQDDAFRNFKEIASEQDMDPKLVLWIYAIKHFRGIASYLRGHKSQREDVRGRIGDLITYLVLLHGMVDEEEVQIAQEKKCEDLVAKINLNYLRMLVDELSASRNDKLSSKGGTDEVPNQTK